MVKVTVGEWDFQSIAEHFLWNSADAGLSKWLAPVHSISRNGLVLFMYRCEPCPKHLLPDKVPACLEEDFHRGNVGLLDGHPVCIDYGRNTAIRMAANAKRMVKPSLLATSSDKRSW